MNLADRLPPNMRAHFRGQPALAAMAVMLCGLIDHVKPGAVSEIDKGFGAVAGTDWEEKIDGKPLFHYGGKSMAQLRLEGVAETTIAKVRKALEDRGMIVHEGEQQPPRAFVPDQRDVASDPFKPSESTSSQPSPALEQSAPEPQPESSPVSPEAEAAFLLMKPTSDSEQAAAEQVAEPTYAGQPLSFYADKSRDQILAIDGMTPQIANKIQKALTKAK